MIYRIYSSNLVCCNSSLQNYEQVEYNIKNDCRTTLSSYNINRRSCSFRDCIDRCNRSVKCLIATYAIWSVVYEYCDQCAHTEHYPTEKGMAVQAILAEIASFSTKYEPEIIFENKKLRNSMKALFGTRSLSEVYDS